MRWLGPWQQDQLEGMIVSVGTYKPCAASGTVCAVAGTNVFPPSAREAPTWLPALGLLELVSPYVDLLSPF